MTTSLERRSWEEGWAVTSRSKDTRWLQALVDAHVEDDAYLPLEASHLLALGAQRRRRRVAAVAVAATVAMAAALAIWIPHGNAELESSSSTLYAASATTSKSGPTGTATARPRASAKRRPRARAAPVDAGVADGTAELNAVAGQELEAKPTRRAKTRPKPSLEDLMASAHAARRERDPIAARAALLEVRKRFPKSAQAGHATFLLGRVELELANDVGAATGWFERYLAEYPRGSLAGQARGRILRSLSASESRDAEAAAADYLAHHPDGPYVDLARRVQRPTSP